jgi:hypothetical protein
MIFFIFLKVKLFVLISQNGIEPRPQRNQRPRHSNEWRVAGDDMRWEEEMSGEVLKPNTLNVVGIHVDDFAFW